MFRRRLSSVKINFDNEVTNEVIEPPDTSTTVIEIGENDEMNTRDGLLCSTERLFHIVVEIPSTEPNLEQEGAEYSTGKCNKIWLYIENCNAESVCCRGSDKFLDLLHQTWNRLNEKLESKCDKSYLETYFMYANFCGVSPFRIGKENERVIWLKKV
ncbi:unnamed protein product [Orchesella dallaii]|uniref:Uncharacterized protein n=1 Tax=Orchesella dallaii TaxID=48710 RepID=A0ABP1PIC7_9HEXA